VAPYTFTAESDRLPHEFYTALYTGDYRGWRWLGHEELRDWHRAAQASYVLRPFYPHQGSLFQALTPTGGDLSIATALMLRRIPVAHPFLSDAASPGRPSRTRPVRALNALLPGLVARLLNVGTAAIVDTGQPLPGIDLLPEPMRWTVPLRIERRRALPWLAGEFGRERNLPSGAPLEPVRMPGPGLAYFNPLATDPAEAAAVLSPALLGLTRELGLAWWCEGSMLFVWTHEGLGFDERLRLAESARRIHRLLTDARTGRWAES
jgi:hypothetical protein